MTLDSGAIRNPQMRKAIEDGFNFLDDKIDTAVAGDLAYESLYNILVAAIAGDMAFDVTPETVDAEIDDQNVGEFQVLTTTIAGLVGPAGAGDLTVTVTGAAITTGSVDVTAAVGNDDDANAIALSIRTALAAETDVTDHFTVSGAGAEVILTADLEAANDVTLAITIDEGAVDFVEGSELEVTNVATTDGVAPYTRDVLVKLVDTEGNSHTWFTGIVPITIADNAAGAASIVTTDPTMTAGEMIITVTLRGVWAAANTNTLAVAQRVVLGETIDAVDSVETSIDT